MSRARWQIQHRTSYTYQVPARESFNEVRLKPLDDASQVCRSFDLRVDPATELRDYVDFYGNGVTDYAVTTGSTGPQAVVEILSGTDGSVLSGVTGPAPILYQVVYGQPTEVEALTLVANCAPACNGSVCAQP